MALFEVGKCYLVKTPAIYYLGRVKEATFAGIVLEQVSEVYETGPLVDFFKGKIQNYESYPKNEVCPIPISAIQAAPSYSAKLPGDK